MKNMENKVAELLKKQKKMLTVKFETKPNRTVTNFTQAT